MNTETEHPVCLGAAGHEDSGKAFKRKSKTCRRVKISQERGEAGKMGREAVPAEQNHARTQEGGKDRRSTQDSGQKEK